MQSINNVNASLRTEIECYQNLENRTITSKWGEIEGIGASSIMNIVQLFIGKTCYYSQVW